MLTTEQLLANARSALDKLLTGEAVVEFRDADGTTVRYAQARSGSLRLYIQELEERLAKEKGETGAVAPMNVWMG